MLLLIFKTPKRHFLGRKHAFWALIGRRTTRSATGTLSKEYKKNHGLCGSNKLLVRKYKNFACGFVSRMCFLVLSFRKIGKKCGSCGGSKFPFSHWKGTLLIQQLVATAQAVIFLYSSLSIPIALRVPLRPMRAQNACFGRAYQLFTAVFRGGSTLGQGARPPSSLVAPQIQKLAVN